MQGECGHGRANETMEQAVNVSVSLKDDSSALYILVEDTSIQMPGSCMLEGFWYSQQTQFHHIHQHSLVK